MSRYRDTGSDCKIYVGDLGSSASKQDLEEAFGYYGPLRNVWVARNPPGFAFIEFEDARDADDAVRGLDGRTVCGRRVRVEASNGALGRRRDRGPPPRRRAFNPDDRCYECGERGHYARDCRRHRQGGGRSSRRSRSPSRSHSRGRQRTRSRSKNKSQSRSRDRSRSRENSAPRGRSPSKSPLRGKSRSRSRSGESIKRGDSKG